MLVLGIILFLLLLLYAGIIHTYHRGWQTMQNQPQLADAGSALIKTTVLIPARNEAANIRKCLDSYLQQDYPSAYRECIVLDDHSEDETADIVLEYADKGVRLVRMAEILNGEPLNAFKKKAIETGISLSTGDLILTTDADCILPPKWISLHVAVQQSTGACFIAAPVRIHKADSWLERFQALDFISLQGITGASVNRGIHAMCNGANLSYLKTAFYAVHGFEGIDRLASGDDMLLMQKISEKFPKRISFIKNPEAIVETAPMPDLGSFLNQRIRWASKTGLFRENSLKGILITVYLLNLLLLGFCIAALFVPGWGLFCVLFILLKAFIEWPFMFSVGQFFGYSRLVRYFPLYQPLHILYTVLAGSFGQFGSYRWKGRKVR